MLARWFRRPAPPEPETPLGRRLGHQPELHRLLAAKVLDAHLRNRHQLLDPGGADLAGVVEEEAALLIRAMIAVAHADGRLDPGERQRILDALTAAQLDPGRRRSLEAAIDEPQCVESLVRQVDSPRLAIRLYSVSLTAMERESPVRRAYLAYLAHRLALPADQVVRLNRRLGRPPLKPG